jgi:hypothetical protein
MRGSSGPNAGTRYRLVWGLQFPALPGIPRVSNVYRELWRPSGMFTFTGTGQAHTQVYGQSQV